MKLVKLTTDMRPNKAGADLLLPDEIADRLLAAGEASNPRDRFGNALSEGSALAQIEARRPSRYKTK